MKLLKPESCPVPQAQGPQLVFLTISHLIGNRPTFAIQNYDQKKASLDKYLTNTIWNIPTSREVFSHSVTLHLDERI